MPARKRALQPDQAPGESQSRSPGDAQARSAGPTNRGGTTRAVVDQTRLPRGGTSAIWLDGVWEVAGSVLSSVSSVPKSASVVALWLGTSLCLLGPLGSARADDAARARALAVQLFDEGDRLMRAGDYARACAKLSESNRLDPQLGALLYLAECYEANGQLASAWGSYREGEEIALRRGDERAQAAGASARALEPRLNRLLLELPPGARPQDYQVTHNALPVAPALLDTAFAIDAGVHHIEVSAKGHKSWSKRLEVHGEGKHLRVRIPRLIRLPRPAAPAAARPEPDSESSQRIAALAVGGLGLLGLGMGGFFALSAQSSFSDSNKVCNEHDVCEPRGVELRSDAKRAAVIASLASAAGAAALAAAGVLWFTAPDGGEDQTANATSVTLTLAPRHVGLQLDGWF